MVRLQRYIVRSSIKQILALITFLLFITPSTLGDSYSELRFQISHPNQIPMLEDFKTPTITQGKTEDLSFKIVNRYKFSDDNTMSKVTLDIEIYRFVTSDTSKDMDEIENTPKFTGGGSNLQTLTNKWTARYHWDTISESESKLVELKIKSSLDTPAGIYFVRMHLNFSFNGTYFDMRSRGYFTDEQWSHASENITDQEGTINGRFIAGRLDLNILKVDGIITDTSFRVKEKEDSNDSFMISSMIYFIFIGILFIIFFIVIIIIYFKYKKKKATGSQVYREYDKAQQK